MLEYGEKIRKRAEELLSSGGVEVFIGYRRGSVAMMNEPVLIRDASRAGELYWDGNCGLNLCNYLTKRKEARIGIVANGCNSRNIVTHIVENQIRREQLHILGLPCEGMVDQRAVSRAVKGGEIEGYEERGEEFVVSGAGFEERFNKADYLQLNCRECRHRNPVIHDELLGEPVKEQEGVEPYRDVGKVEEMDAEAKWGFFRRLISPCIRCYACRNACPLCYCPVCFVDETQPQWVGKSIDETDTMTFHLLRAYHCAGRCTDCGACERVCPVGIRVRQFTKKLNKDAEEYFGWEAGLEEGVRPPLDVYRPEDFNEFIK